MGIAGSFRSSVGLKAWAALSGLLLSAWVVLHALGLLAALQGRAVIDAYAAKLHGQPGLLWAMRAGLFATATIHFGVVLALARRARAARGARRGAVRYGAGSLISRAVRAGGATLLVLLVLHVLHMTTGTLHPAFSPGHVYANLVRGLAPPLVACAYLAAALGLGLDLVHGLWSAPRSLGCSLRSARNARRPLAALAALALVLGFAAVPIAVLAGVLR